MNAEVNIPRPRLLNGSGGTERWITPTRVSINLAITPLSDATMSLPQGESIPARGYVELFTCMGSAGIFRVRSPQDAYGMLTTTAELESAIAEVGDYLVKVKKDEMVSAQSAINTIWGYYSGSKWQLGSISALGSGNVALEVNYDRVLDAMLAILDQKPECMMSFDYSTTPWTLNIVARDTTVSAEGRLARNVNYARVSYDDTELCTRVYYERQSTTDSTDGLDLTGIPTFNAGDRYSKNSYVVYDSKVYLLPNGHEKDVTWANTTKTLKNDIPTSVWEYMDADTIGTYGRVERTISTGSDYTQAEAEQAASEYLRKHKQPKVSVEISAAELSHITGESFDAFAIGKLCRLALSDYNVTVERNVTNLYFEDVYEYPDRITVTLADEEDTAVTFLHDVDSKGGSGGGGGGGKKKDDVFKEFQTFFEMDDRNINLYAVQYKTVDEILKQAGLHIDANGVLVYAEDNENNLGSKLSVEAGRITAIATRMDNAENILSQAGLEIDTDTGVLIYHTDNANMIGSQFSVQAGKIAMVVGTTDQGGNYIKAASITLAINNAGSSAMINADKIYLLGDTIANTITADYIQTKIASLASLNVASLTSERGGISVYSVGTTTFVQGGVTCYVPHAISDLQITGPTNNVYTLQKKTFANDSWSNVGTFSRATTLTGVWSGGGYTVTASPQGDTIGTIIGKKGESWNGNICTVTVGYENPTSGAMVSTGCTFNVDASGRDAASGAASGRHGSSYDWDFIITRGDGSTKTLQIDCSSIYTAARSGYTLGTFTLASVTLQGGQDSVYIEASSGGTDYYQADSAVDVYPGDGGSFTVQGTAAGAITAIGSAVWFKQHSSSETPSGTWYSYHTSNPGGTTYKRFSAGTTYSNLRNPGTVTKYARGTKYSITPIKSNTKKHLLATTRYKAGTTVSDTYYTKS